MSSSMNLQQFADKYGFRVIRFVINGPHGEIYHAGSGEWFYFTRQTGTHKFNPVKQAKLAIEAIGLRYVAPTEPAKPLGKDRRAFIIEKRKDGWYVSDKAGPFKTREEAREARARLRAAIAPGRQAAGELAVQ